MCYHRYLLEGREDNYETSQDRIAISGPRFEHRTSRIRGRVINTRLRRSVLVWNPIGKELWSFYCWSDSFTSVEASSCVIIIENAWPWVGRFLFLSKLTCRTHVKPKCLLIILQFSMCFPISNQNYILYINFSFVLQDLISEFFVGNPGGKKPISRPRRRWGIILKWI
jgi:hypothetical protein